MKITDFKKIYVTCTGNTCRSPMAERIFKEEIAQRGLQNSGISVKSRQSNVSSDLSTIVSNATFSPVDAKKFILAISRGSREIILKYFGDYDFVKNHVPRAFTESELEQADIVLTMEKDHKNRLKNYLEAYTPDGRVKVYTLGEVVGLPFENVKDPLAVCYVKKSKSDPGSVSDEQDDLSEEKQIFDLKPYEETFAQLTSMINTLFEKGSIQLKTIESEFQDALQSDYSFISSDDDKDFGHKNRERITQRDLDYCLNPLTQEEKQMYVELLQEFKQRGIPVKKHIPNNGLTYKIFSYLSEKKALITELYYLGDDAVQYAKTLPSPQRKSTEKMKQHLLKVIKAVDKGQYDSKGHFSLDYEKIGVEIAKDLEGSIDNVASDLKIPCREKAFLAYNFGMSIWEITKKVYDQQGIYKLYQKLTGNAKNDAQIKTQWIN